MMPPINEDLPELHLVLKQHLFAGKGEWERVRLVDLLDRARQIPAQNLHEGFAAIWLRPYAFTATGTAYPWLILDVEAQGHDDLAANIRAAQYLLTQVVEQGLGEGLQVFLTGRGFRFAWPFLVPRKLAKGFNAWLKTTPEVDPAPQKKNGFFRLLAYRGNTRQNRDPRDIHVHKLEVPADLFQLTPEAYRRLVAGRPDVNAYLACLEAILPYGFAPPAWTSLLERATNKALLKESIVTVGFARSMKKAGADWQKIHSYLDQQGLRIVRELPIYDTQIFKLNYCPQCGRSDGSPYLTASAQLKCFHANSCPAGELGQTGSIKGLPPWVWLEGYQRPEEEQGLMEAPSATVGCEEAREVITAALRGSEDLVVSVTPGVGKTTTTLQEVAYTSQDRRVLITVPTLQLADEMYQKALEMGVPVRLIRGRADDNCDDIAWVKELAHRGFSPGLIACPSCPSGKMGRCVYNQQFENLPEQGLIVSTHAAAMKFSKKQMACSLWVLDENPRDSIITTTTVQRGSITAVKSQLSAEAQAIVQAMETAAEGMLGEIDGEHKHGRLWATRKPPDSYWKDNTDDLWSLASISAEGRAILTAGLAPLRRQWDPVLQSGETKIKWAHRLLKLGIYMVALDWFWIALGEMPGSAYIRVERHPKRPIRFLAVNKQTIPRLAPRMVVLDGTANLGEMESLLNRKFHLVEAQVPLPDCRKVWNQRGLGKVKAGKKEDWQFEVYLKEALGHLRPTDRRVFLATHQNVEERILRLAQEMAPHQEFASSHFWASRGVNSFQDFDACICIGTPTASPTETLDTAMVLFDTQEEREAWQAWLGQSDLEQTIHRVRPVYGGKTLIVVGSSWPRGLGKPDLQIDQRRWQAGRVHQVALERLRWCVNNYGFVTRELAWMMGVGLKQEAQAIRTTQQVVWRGVGSEVCQTLINTILEFVIPSEAPLPVLLPRSHDWGLLLTQLKLEFPEMASLTVKLKSCGNQWTHGFGTLGAARRLYNALGAHFDQDYWEGLEEPRAAVPLGRSLDVPEAQLWHQPQLMVPFGPVAGDYGNVLA